MVENVFQRIILESIGANVLLDILVSRVLLKVTNIASNQFSIKTIQIHTIGFIKRSEESEMDFIIIYPAIEKSLWTELAMVKINAVYYHTDVIVLQTK